MWRIIDLVFNGLLLLSVSVFAQETGPKQKHNSQTQTQQAFVKSPILDFKPQSNCPVNILYSRTVALPTHSKNVVRVELVAEYKDDWDIDNFTVVCEEEKKVPESAARKETRIYEVRSSQPGPISFKVEASSRLTFYVKSVTFVEGSE